LKKLLDGFEKRSLFFQMLPTPRRASDNRIEGRKQSLRSPQKPKRNALEEKVAPDDNFDLFSGALNNNDPFSPNRSKSVGCDSASMRKRAASPQRGTPAYLSPVKNPHQVKTVGTPVKENSSEDESYDDKEDDATGKPKGRKTDILPLMYQGMKMYKFGKKNTKPKLKTVFLTKDNRYLKWSSQLKKSEKKQVDITAITRVEGGMKSAVYEQVMNLPRDNNFALNPNLAISIYYETGSQKSKTLNMVATVNMHHQIWIEGLGKLVKVCRSGGDPENIVEIFHNITTSAEDVNSTSLLPREAKSFRWEKINADHNEARSVSPDRDCVEIVTGSGVQKRPYSKSLPGKSNFLTKAWV